VTDEPETMALPFNVYAPVASTERVSPPGKLYDAGLTDTVRPVGPLVLATPGIAKNVVPLGYGREEPLGTTAFIEVRFTASGPEQDANEADNVEPSANDLPGNVAARVE
jgi:hypothetical protein